MTYTYKINPQELQAIALFASTEQSRYYLNGVFFEMYENNEQPALIATDGHRIGTLYAELRKPAIASFILGNDDIKKLLAIYKLAAKGHKSSKELLVINITKGDDLAIKCEVALSDVAVCGSFESKAVDGNFPDWRRVIPDASATEFTPYMSFNVDYMADFGAAARLITSMRLPQIKIEASQQEAPIRITMPYCADFLGALMPMRA